MAHLPAPHPEDAATGKHIVDLLIEERAKHLRDNKVLWPFIRACIYPILQYRLAVNMADEVRDLNGPAVMDYLSDLLTLDIHVTGAEHIPETGPVIITPNHPTGIVDGTAVWDAVGRRRRDMIFFANRDAIRTAPKLDEVIIPVEWEMDKRNHGRSRETLRAAAGAFQAGKAVILFPSGRLAEMKGGKLYEREWLPTALAFSKKYGAPIVPLHIKGLNSKLYYFLCKTSQELRDMTLFHEIMNKKNYPYEMTFGAAIAPETLPGTGEETIQSLQRFVEQDMAEGETLWRP